MSRLERILSSRFEAKPLHSSYKAFYQGPRLEVSVIFCSMHQELAQHDPRHRLMEADESWWLELLSPLLTASPTATKPSLLSLDPTPLQRESYGGITVDVL